LTTGNIKRWESNEFWGYREALEGGKSRSARMTKTI